MKIHIINILQHRMNQRLSGYLNHLARFCYMMLLTAAFIPLHAQETPKYRDIYAQIDPDDPRRSYNLLFEYQRLDPFNANLYFQLAKISLRLAHECDPLTQAAEAEYFYYHANVYSGLALRNLDDKEVRKNRAFYDGIVTDTSDYKLTLDDVKNYLDSQVVVVKHGSSKTDSIRYFYNKTTEAYNRCTGLFLNINTAYSKLKDICLASDTSLSTQINLLKINYDSAMWFFAQYKEHLAQFPIRDYHQELNIRPIQTYRLDGLTGSNFLNPVVDIWNYGLWVDELNAVISNDIASLRADIETTGTMLDSKATQLDHDRSLSDSIPTFAIDPILLNRIGKFDNPSLISSLFQFQEAKIKLLLTSKYSLNSPVPPKKTIRYGRVVRYCYDLLNLKLHCDTLLTTGRQLVSEQNFLKYRNFLTPRYTDNQGLLTVLSNEQNGLDSIIASNLENLKILTLREIYGNETAQMSFKGSQLSSRIAGFAPATAEPKVFYTQALSKDKNGQIYLCGYARPAPNVPTQAFIAKADDNQNIIWLNILKAQGTDNEAALLVYALDEGCAVTVSQLAGSEFITSTVIFDPTGKETSRIKCNTSSKPRQLLFDPINERLYLACKADETLESQGVTQSATVSCQQPDGTLVWENRLNFSGEIASMLLLNEDLLVYCNFSQYTNPQQQLIRLKPGQTNTLVYHIDRNGSVPKSVAYISEESYTLLTAYKLDSETINLIGLKNLVDKSGLPASAESLSLFYAIDNGKGLLVYSNLDDNGK